MQRKKPSATEKAVSNWSVSLLTAFNGQAQ
jgi:hypothetical protein